MTRLQDDIVGFYNDLTDFSDQTLINGVPIRVYYDEKMNALCFEQRGRKIMNQALNYYCENLKLLNTYLLPEHYDNLMRTLAEMIGSGVMIRERILIKPKKYGFELYETQARNLKDGPQRVSNLDLVFWNSWLFKKYVKFNYKKVL